MSSRGLGQPSSPLPDSNFLGWGVIPNQNLSTINLLVVSDAPADYQIRIIPTK